MLRLTTIYRGNALIHMHDSCPQPTLSPLGRTTPLEKFLWWYSWLAHAGIAMVLIWASMMCHHQSWFFLMVLQSILMSFCLKVLRIDDYSNPSVRQDDQFKELIQVAMSCSSSWNTQCLRSGIPRCLSQSHQ